MRMKKRWRSREMRRRAGRRERGEGIGGGRIIKRISRKSCEKEVEKLEESERGRRIARV